jgi:hypothetical protein
MRFFGHFRLSAVAGRLRHLQFEPLEPRDMLASADLSDWVGIGNLNGANDYVVTSATSAGGIFAERRAVAASLSDHTLLGGTFDWNSTLAMSGTIQFTGAFDPVFFFGWFDSTNPNERIGIGAADPSPAGSGVRWQTQSGNAAATGIVSQNFTGSTATSKFAPGIYSFTFNYDGAGHMTGTFGTINFARNYSAPTNPDLNMDRFGFLQKSSTDDDAHTFIVNVSNINYTGETQYSPPAPTLPGDYNGDNVIDAADYVVWRKTLGTAAALPNDATPPDVTQEDYGPWQTNFSGTLPTPAAPMDLTATPAVAQVNLSWTDNANNETGFAIDRRIGPSGLFTQIDTVGANNTAYVNTGLTANVTYEYQVRALNSAGSSAPSNTATATTPQVTITATNYSRTQIYHGSMGAGYLPGDPSWTSWVGAWIMPNGDLMMSVTQATGREQPFHHNPSPYNYSNLDINVVYMRGVRANDGSGNVTWTKVTESDVSFTTAEDSGKGTHANNGPTTIALNDGSLIRRVYGWDYGEFPDMPGTTFLQRSTDGGLTWSAAPVSTDGGQTWSDPSPIQEFLLDPTTTTVQMTRTLRLRDGRLLMVGNVWNGLNTQSAPREPLMMVSSDEAVSWQRVPMTGADWTKFNEWDVEELDNGDLFIVARINAQNQVRWQGVMTKTGNSWQYNALTASSLPHSGHPELLKTTEGPVLHIATTGTHWTTDNGATWNVLTGGPTSSRYYPDALQTEDGWIYVFAHLSSPGGDDNYGGANQAVFMDKYRLVPQAVPGAGGGDSNLNESPMARAAEIAESSFAPASALATVDTVGSNSLPDVRSNSRRPLFSAGANARESLVRYVNLLNDFPGLESASAHSIDKVFSDADTWPTSWDWVGAEIDGTLALLSEGALQARRKCLCMLDQEGK